MASLAVSSPAVAAAAPLAPAARRRTPWSTGAKSRIIAIMLGMAAATANWPELKVTRWDMFGYYLYLPATTVYHDLRGLSFVPELLDRTDLTNRGNPAHPLGNWEVSRARTNPDSYVIKYTMGQALLWWPFFQAAHWYTQHYSKYPPDGYSAPYQLAMYLAGLCYALLGLGLMRRLLLRYFSDRLSAVILLIVYLGTNYLVYSVFRSLYAHSPLFMLHTATLLMLSHWLARPRWTLAFGLGFTIGMAVLMRPSEMIILLVPLLLGVATVADLRARLALAGQHLGHVAIAGAVAIAVNVPQLLYWHTMSGHWVYDSYPNEKFDFLHPHILLGLFSFNNGWLTYTPVMGLAVIGIGLLWRQRREWFWLLITYLPLHLFISYSWWCWWYMDGVGSRTMVQAYPVLTLPLGVCLHALWQRGQLVRVATTLAVTFCIALVMFQAWQLRQGIYITEYMTSRYYGTIFGKTHLDRNDLMKYDANEATPNPDDFQLNMVYFNDFSKDTSSVITNEYAQQPPVCRVDKQHPFSPGYAGTLGEFHLKPGDFVQGRVQAFFPQKEYGIYSMPRMVIEYRHPNEDPYKWRSIRITNKVGEVSILWGGTAGVWDEVGFASKVPKDACPDDVFKVYVINGSSDLPLYIDNLSVTTMHKP
jgi:hypothetical protein